MTCSLIQNDSCSVVQRMGRNIGHEESHSAYIPVVEIVKQEIELGTGCKAFCSRNDVMIGRVELMRETSKHGSDG